MATNHTSNYNLNQYAANDSFLRTDFNEDNQKIEAAIDGKSEVAIGTYVGDGSENQIISLSFTPRAVHIEDNLGRRDSASAHVYGGLIVTGHDLHGAGEIVSGGFCLHHSPNSHFLNNANVVYRYIAFK